MTSNSSLFSQKSLRISRRGFLAGTTAGLAGVLSMSCQSRPVTGPSPEVPPRRSPNIVMIVADDLGYADLGCQGCRDVPTPNIDSLAQNGVRFTNGYVSAPLCSPTRAGLHTGRYQQRFGHEFNPGPAASADSAFGLPLSETTLGDRLKAAGYATGLVGKWHLGYQPEFHPLKRGFDEFYGFLGGAHPYLSEDPKNPVLRGATPEPEPGYLTDAFGREAVAFIKAHQTAPFYLMVTFNAVHTPQDVLSNYLQRVSGIQDPTRKRMAAMLIAMDDAVGKIQETIRNAQLESDTLFFFISDNGGPTPKNGSINAPLAGYKSQLLEGGIRVPFLCQWKGRIPEAKVYDHPVISLDIHATCLAAAGIGGIAPPEKPLDGVNLLPFLQEEIKEPPHNTLYWRIGEQSAIRQGDYKLLRRDNTEKLFNLAADIGESEDLAAREPQTAERLRNALNQWNSELMTPLWKNGKKQNPKRRTKKIGKITVGNAKGKRS